jgi:hypothetical protein
LDSYPSDRKLTSLAAAAFGAASFYYVGPLFELASPRHDLVFLWHGNALVLFLPVLIDMLLLALGLFIVLAAVRHSSWPRRIVWSCLFCLPPVAIIRYSFDLTETTPPHWLQRVLFLFFSLLIVVSLFLLKSHVFERIRGISHVALSSFAFAGAILFLEVSYFGFEARHLNAPPFASETTNPVPPSAAPHGRIIWIVLDELAYRQAFAQHPTGEDLPAFDALKAQSTLFTNVAPAARHTEVAIPALLTGDEVRDARSNAAGQLQLKTGGRNWIDFDPRSTIFTDAQSLGYHTAIAGWYEPYCRILGGAFSYCTWFFHTEPNSLSPLKEIGMKMINRILHPVNGGEQSRHLQDYLVLAAATDRILQSKQYDFVYLHLPLPHPAGIYDRKTGNYALNRSSYVDNLALADKYIQHVRQLLEAQGEWDDDTILLMGDHSWRIFIWQNVPSWSAEDELASRPGFDPRPAYLLKLPHQQAGATVDSEFQALRTRSLLNALLRDQLHTPADVQNWAGSTSNTLP